MASGHSEFKVSAGYKSDVQRTRIVLDVKQWGTPDFSTPSIHTYTAGTGWDVSIYIEELSQLEEIRDALIAACKEHQAATCTSTDPTDHQGNTCPVHEAATQITEGVTS